MACLLLDGMRSNMNTYILGRLEGICNSFFLFIIPLVGRPAAVAQWGFGWISIDHGIVIYFDTLLLIFLKNGLAKEVLMSFIV